MKNQSPEFEVSSLRELRSLARAIRLHHWGRPIGPLVPFNAWLRFRLGALRLWPARLDRLSLTMSDGLVKFRAGPGNGDPNTPPPGRADRHIEYALVTKFAAADSDETLISLAAADCREVFADFVPGADLPVLADEFLGAGIASIVFSHRLSFGDVTAQLRVQLGVQWVEATLHVSERQYPVVRVKTDDYWPSAFGSMSLSASRLMIKAKPNGVIVSGRPGPRGALVTGDRWQARRFVVELEAKKVIHNWDLTGPRGVPESGTGFDG